MRNILVVDDSALMRRVICDIINTDKQFQANDVCRDGLEAYERLKTTSYDAVILDVNMPKMDGLQLLEKLQKGEFQLTGNRYENPRKSDFSEKEETKEETNGEREI